MRLLNARQLAILLGIAIVTIGCLHMERYYTEKELYTFRACRTCFACEIVGHPKP